MSPGTAPFRCTIRRTSAAEYPQFVVQAYDRRDANNPVAPSLLPLSHKALPVNENRG